MSPVEGMTEDAGRAVASAEDGRADPSRMPPRKRISMSVINFWLDAVLLATLVPLGGIAAVPSYFAIIYRSRTRLDDSLDVFAAHGIGGITGALLTGVFAVKAWGGADGLIAGNPGQVVTQAIGVAASIAWAAISC